MKRELESIEIPGESEARARAWNVVSVCLRRPPAGRAPSQVAPRDCGRRRRRCCRRGAELAGPGRARRGSRVVGVERAQPALFSLPSTGQLLVASDAGVWVVQEDGSKRLLGPYREASWSPFGRFVVAARENELTALEPDGDVRWTLARPGAGSPRWTGTRVRHADCVFDRTGITPRVVAGDGAGDGQVCAASARKVPAAWKPGAGFVLALVAPSGRP